MIRIKELNEYQRNFIKELETLFETTIVPPKIITVSNREEFNTLSGRLESPKWVVACVMQKNILIFDDENLEKETIHKKESVNTIIKHELVHLMYHKKLGTSEPLWLNEGLASYLSGKKIPSAKIDKKDIIRLFKRNNERGNTVNVHKKGAVIVKHIMDELCEK